MNKNVTKQTIHLYWQFLSKRKFTFAVTLILAVIAVVVGQFLVPLIVASVLDKLSGPNRESLSIIGDFGPLLGLLVAFLGFETILWRIQNYILWTLEAKTMKEIMERCFDFLMHQTHSFHTNSFGGSLVSQTNKFVYAFERIVDEFVYSLTTIVTAYIAAIIILWPRAPQYVIVFMIVSLGYITALYWRVKVQHPYNVREATAESQQTGQIADAITNIQTIKPFANEGVENVLFEKKTNNVLQKSLANRNVSLVNELISNMFNNVLYFLAILFAIITIVIYDANLGTMLLITSYSSNLLRRLWEMQRVMRNLTRGFGDAHDMTELLQQKPEVKDPLVPKQISSVRGDIRFENVTYTYPENPDKPLFKNLDLHIKQGEKIGLVGHSGGGKTTITKLVLRLMDIDKGKILVDGIDISRVTQKTLRDKISYVPQEPLMFHRTLSDNIRYGRLDAEQQEIEAVAKMANAHDFITALSKSYNTLVGERGTKLSGGQRQRVAIARAMLKNAPILLLDEATSSLDSESEQYVQDALWKLIEGRTAIIIAHRLSTIQKMDRILVLEEGRIVEQGSHKELIRINGIYANLWKHQSGGFLEDTEE